MAGDGRVGAEEEDGQDQADGHVHVDRTAEVCGQTADPRSEDEEKSPGGEGVEVLLKK